LYVILHSVSFDGPPPSPISPDLGLADLSLNGEPVSGLIVAHSSAAFGERTQAGYIKATEAITAALRECGHEITQPYSSAGGAIGRTGDGGQIIVAQNDRSSRAPERR
jgi:hypothetical protein